jgi:pimeloyl-ACP methyl ester carboxylesterase
MRHQYAVSAARARHSPHKSGSFLPWNQTCVTLLAVIRQLSLCCSLLFYVTQACGHTPASLAQAERVARPHIKSPAAACAAGGEAVDGVVILQTTLAGVPALLRVPKVIAKPPIVLWHGFGPPASESALMKALPLDEVAAVKVYLGLPLFGARAPSGDGESLAQRQASDYASRIFEPVVMGAAKELPAVVTALIDRQCLRASEKIGLFGFSAGGAAVLFALAERDVRVQAAVTLNAPTGLREAIEAVEHATKRSYVWTPAARQLAERSDSVRRAREIAAGDPPPALLIFHGSADEVVAPQATLSLRDALLPLYAESGNRQRLHVVIAPDVSHDWTEPQALQQVRIAVASWFDQNL